MILIDNYDSFTYNVVQYLKILGIEPKVFKNDEVSIEELKKLDFSSIIISPGPHNPDNAGISLEVIKEFYKSKKILGICLGHQCIAKFFGAKVVRAQEPLHGRVSKIYFSPDKIFEDLEQGFEATRYHSLVVEEESLPECLVPIAWADSSPFTLYPPPVLMALKHHYYPIYGVQFHPEAILTQGGMKLLENFLEFDLLQSK